MMPAPPFAEERSMVRRCKGPVPVVHHRSGSIVASAMLQMRWMDQAGDPDILTDFIIPENRTGDTLDGNVFNFTGMRGIFGSVITSFKGTKASKAEFPALDGQCTSLAVLQFPSAAPSSPADNHGAHDRMMHLGALGEPSEYA
uniref:Germin-like protein 9-2 n=1 Tax=Nicotiana tabacum TaxID=4097 RepID=A0A1S4D4D7_TOBAC|nr:PREDICTED: putative germin-like protein 9-2 [Nicotiana tabacum]